MAALLRLIYSIGDDYVRENDKIDFIVHDIIVILVCIDCITTDTMSECLKVHGFYAFPQVTDWKGIFGGCN